MTRRKTVDRPTATDSVTTATEPVAGDRESREMRRGLAGTPVAIAPPMRTPDARLSALLPLTLLAAACGSGPSESVGSTGQKVVASGDIYNFGALAHPGSCMDAQGGGTGDGTQIQEWPCNGTGAQSYELARRRQRRVHHRQHAGEQVRRRAGGAAPRTAPRSSSGTATAPARSRSSPRTRATGSSLREHEQQQVPRRHRPTTPPTAPSCSSTTATERTRRRGTRRSSAPRRARAAAGSEQRFGRRDFERRRRTATPPGWTLTWSDEFDGPDGSGVDPNNWSFDTGGSGWGNQELEYYTSGTANAVVTGGNARHHRDDRTARRTTRAGTAPASTPRRA